MKNYLEFERDIKGLEEELEKLKDPLISLILYKTRPLLRISLCKKLIFSPFFWFTSK